MTVGVSRWYIIRSVIALRIALCAAWGVLAGSENVPGISGTDMFVLLSPACHNATCRIAPSPPPSPLPAPLRLPVARSAAGHGRVDGWRAVTP
jgi:hypothetical protein